MPSTSNATRSPNDEVMSFWRDVMVEKYRRFRSVLVGATALHAKRVHSIDEPPRSARVLDVGCGFGETAIDWARRVGERGQVVGIDPCTGFLDVARADARAANVANVSFRCGDAQTTPLSGFDRVFSAFGVMFFAQPVAALRNLRAALEPGGRMQLLVWDTRASNPWLTLALEACESVLPPMVANAATCGPGPFSMSDPEALRAMLEAAGLGRVEILRLSEDVCIGADIERAMDFQLTLGPAGERMRVAGALGTPTETRIRDEIRRLFAACQRESGVWLRSSVWYATGSRATDRSASR
jgi:ubiquinone/menaquinone biosynthesis C-methylase UbiE